MKCINCKFSELQYFTGYDRTGVFSSQVCKEDITIGKIVDGKIERKCTMFRPIKELEAANAKG